MDRWTKLNEVMQNLIAGGMAGAYLFMTVRGLETPNELKVFVGAILLYFGFKVYRGKQN